MADTKTIRTYALLLLFVLLRPFGNLSLAWGTKHFPQALSIHPVVYIRAMLDPFVALGIAMLILSLLTRLALLSLADLSFVLPVTAIGYVLARARRDPVGEPRPAARDRGRGRQGRGVARRHLQRRL